MTKAEAMKSLSRRVRRDKIYHVNLRKYHTLKNEILSYPDLTQEEKDSLIQYVINKLKI